MMQDYNGEIWKKVDFKISEEVTSNFRLEISNFGRIKSFNKLCPEGRIINGSSIGGYPVVKFTLYKKNVVNENIGKIENLRKSILFHQEKIKVKEQQILLKLERNHTITIAKKELEILQKSVISFKKEIATLNKKYEKKRSIYVSYLIHKLVAEYFLPKPTFEDMVVAHLDYEKLNNHFLNLQWMTKTENYEHQKNSPYVKKYKANVQVFGHKGGYRKLRETDVMIIKKKILENKLTLRNIAKQFGVSDMQIQRIKTGENWGKVKAIK